jgi:hypothetical protein
MRDDVAAAVGWLAKHPRHDYVDAAFAVAADPHQYPKTSGLGGKLWPDFVAAVKEATQNQTILS